MNIKIGGLYHIPNYTWILRNFIDPEKDHHNIPWNGKDTLPPSTPFIPLKSCKIYLNRSHGYDIKSIFYIKILISTGIISWLPVQENDFTRIIPMTNCDKEL